MGDEARGERGQGIQVVQLRWPLSPLASLLEPEARRTVLENLRCMSCPSFAMTDLNDLTWVVYHRPVLACFERVLQTLIPSPPHTSYPQVFAGHALLSAVFERLFGPAIGDRCASVLDSRSRRLLEDYAAVEVTYPDDRALREMSVAILVELIYGLPHIVSITDQAAKLSFLRYALSLFDDEGRDFPDRAPYTRLLTTIRQALESGEAASQPELIRDLDRLIYTNKDTPAYPARGRVIEARLENKPQVRTAASRLEDYLKGGGVLALSSAGTVEDEASRPGPSPRPSSKNQFAIPAHIGPYLIQDTLGSGGMGTVYRARGPTGSPVALKVLHPELSSQVNDLVRFGREVEIARRLRHPHIVQALDYGVSEGHAFLAMQLLEGGSLEELLRKRKRLGEGETWTLIRQMASTLDYTWGLPKKYMHRDIKAENILFDRFGRPKLTDFGLATGTSRDATRFTRTGELLGTPLYMAPELLPDHARSADIRADLWALGVLAWRCLTGHFPFDAPSPVVLANKIRTQAPDRTKPQPPSEASRLLLDRLLSKSPEDRFQSPRALLDAIEDQRFRPRGPGSPSDGPLVLEWRPGHHLFVFMGDELRFGRNSGEDQDLCLRVLPASQFAALTTCISGRHGRIRFDGARFLIEHQGANGLRKNDHFLEPGAPEWLDFADRLSIAEVLELEAWPQLSGALFTRPTNHARHSYLLLDREYDLSMGPRSAEWPRLPARLFARDGALFLAERGEATPLAPGQVLEVGGEPVRVHAATRAMFK